MPGGVAGEQAEMPASYADFPVAYGKQARISSIKATIALRAMTAI